MGIKTKLCSMGGGSTYKDMGNLALWRYSNEVISGKTLLYNYAGEYVTTLTNLNAYYNSGSEFPRRCAYLINGTTPAVGMNVYYNNGEMISRYVINYVANSSAFLVNSAAILFRRNQNYDTSYTNTVIINSSIPNVLCVPKVNGNAIINDWYNSRSSGTDDTNRNIPFYNNLNINQVDLQGVPFRNNSMLFAFNNSSVTRVKGIPEGQNMYGAFYECKSLEYVSDIPASATNVEYLFSGCSKFNQNIKIHNTWRSVNGLFQGTVYNFNTVIPEGITHVQSLYTYCPTFNQNVQFPSSVVHMVTTFGHCRNFNQNIKIPNSVTNMSSCFYNCINFNQNIKIPSGIINMAGTFAYCAKYKQTPSISKSVIDVSRLFRGCYNFEYSVTSLFQMFQFYTNIVNAEYCFSGCSNVTNAVQTFSGCTNLTNAVECFSNCTNLVWANYCFRDCTNLTNAYNCFSNLKKLRNMSYCFWHCNRLEVAPNIPEGVEDISHCFSLCDNIKGDIYIDSTEIEICAYYMTNINTSRKNVYIYFKYNNGVLTKTYNTFYASPAYYANGAMGSTNALANRRNCYVYNRGLAPW